VVVTVAVLVFDAGPLRATEVAESVQVESAGSPPQVIATVPVKPFTGVKVMV
jgi:hypothetical protein